MDRWDLIVVGAGPAGLTAGMYGVRKGLKTLILEREVPGGLAAEIPLIENYPGFPEGIGGFALVNKMIDHCIQTGTVIHELEKVVELDLDAPQKTVKTDKAVYTTATAIIASGESHRRLETPGEKEFLGRGISYCAVCDGPFFKGKEVMVVGGGNMAAVTAAYLSNLASNVKLAHQETELRAEKKLVKDLQKQGVEILGNTVTKEIRGDGKVKSVILFNTKTMQTKEYGVEGVFVQIGEEPNSRIAEEAGIEVDEKGYIVTDQHQRTNINGVYAVGAVTACQVKKVGTCVGQAIVAANDASEYLKSLYQNDV